MRLNAIVTLLIVMLAVIGCSGDIINPIDAPETKHETGDKNTDTSERMLWGIWDISYSLDELTINVTPFRDVLKPTSLSILSVSPSMASMSLAR